MATLTEFKTDHHNYFEDENGHLQGEYKSWYDNGQLSEHSHYVNDRRHGEHMSWYANGQLAYHCHYDNGIRHGEYKSWDENGTIRKHCVYIANEKLDMPLDIDLTNLTHKDKFILNLKYGDFHWLP